MRRVYRPPSLLLLGALVFAGPLAGQDPSTIPPGQGVWANYDFVPGDRILFAEDFSADPVGDFPRRLRLRAGNLEVVAWRGARYLRATGNGEILIPLAETLPDRFTLEFDYLTSGLTLEVLFNDDETAFAQFSQSESGVLGEVSAMGTAEIPDNEFARARIMADGESVKVYVNEKRVANVPNAPLGRDRGVRIRFAAWEEGPFFLGNIRVAAGGRKLYDALAAEGRIATQGILFDTGSDRIRPESTPTLKEIGEMLQQHPELRIRIEGHTDNVGDDAANQALSERRASAVRDHLLSRFGVAGGRLEVQGLGETRPMTSNDTAEGRQQNRRVELVRLSP